MRIITNENLEYNCKSVISYYDNNDLQLYTLFLLLYSTGVRINEAINLNLWQLINADVVQLNGLKGANPRYFNLIDLPFEVQRYFIDSYNVFRFTSYTNLVRYLNRALQFKVYYQSSKSINFHMFRHNYIRKLYAKTKNIDTVLQELGKTVQSDISTYLYTNLYIN